MTIKTFAHCIVNHPDNDALTAILQLKSNHQVIIFDS